MNNLDKWEQRGTFGDMFGAVNSFFSALAFAGVIITILLQTSELKLQREELVETRNELKGQKEQLEIQNSNLIHQISDNIFFNLLEKHNQITSSLELDKKQLPATYRVTLENDTYRGRDVFNGMYHILSGDNEIQLPEKVIDTYKEIQENYNYILGHYFRNFYQILAFIDELEDTKNEHPKIEQKRYAKFLRAQLSTPELIILFINCLDGIVDEGKFKQLLKKYAMLEHLPIITKESHYSVKGAENLLFEESMINQYFRDQDCGAYGKNPFFSNKKI